MALTDSGERRLISAVICLSVSIIAVALRFWCKVSLKARITSDDWWILASCVIYVATDAVVLWGLFTGGEGRQIDEIISELRNNPTPQVVASVERFLLSLFIGTVTSLGFLYAVKISICLLYRRIFSIPRYKTLSAVAIGISTAWFIAASVANICICIPVDIFWHRSKPGRCLNFNLFYLINGIFEVLIDSAILSIPIFAVSRTHMPRKARVIVSGIFLLGGFAIVTCILRLVYVYEPNAEFVSFSDSEFWTRIHIATAILCASLPVYKPIRTQIGNLVVRLRDRYGSSLRFLHSYSTRKTESERSDHLESGSYQMDSLQASHHRDFHKVIPHKSQESVVSLIQPPPQSITVMNRFEVRHVDAPASSLTPKFVGEF
ncbi:hypothetical protein F4818DRAFT_427401 [Hypoxylon cercidicola]|nr:hypothetical protein F4818DRAFT_427401 [Hypoxylon cercidicola]